MQKVPAALELITKFVIKHNFSTLDTVIMACNTAHLLADEIVKKTGIPLSSLVLNTIDHIENLKIKRVGIVSSITTIDSKLFTIDDVDLIIPTDMQLNQLKHMIKRIIDGIPSNCFEQELDAIVESLFVRGAEAVILACTELELVMMNSMRLGLIRPLEITVCKIINEIKI